MKMCALGLLFVLMNILLFRHKRLKMLFSYFFVVFHIKNVKGYLHLLEESVLV